MHRDLPVHVKAVALFGAPGTGKKTLARAAANACGAVFFDLSPRNTDGKYPGKSVSTLTHIAFKVAKTMAPSVIFIDDAETVFLTDKKKMRELPPTKEPTNRIKKELVKEVKALRPGDRVVVVGCAREPQILAKKDRRAFLDFFQKRVATPLPNFGARRSVWRALIRRRGGGELDDAFDLSMLARLSEGHSQGAMDACARSVLTARRVGRYRGSREALDARDSSSARARRPTPPETVAELREWTAGLPEFDRFKPKPPEEPPVEVRRRRDGESDGDGERERDRRRGFSRRRRRREYDSYEITVQHVRGRGARGDVALNPNPKTKALAMICRSTSRLARRP